MKDKIKAQAGKIIKNLKEIYLALLVVVGLPLIVLAYVDLKAAISLSVLLQISLLYLSLKFEANK